MCKAVQIPHVPGGHTRVQAWSRLKMISILHPSMGSAPWNVMALTNSDLQSQSSMQKLAGLVNWHAVMDLSSQFKCCCGSLNKPVWPNSEHWYLTTMSCARRHSNCKALRIKPDKAAHLSPLF